MTVHCWIDNIRYTGKREAVLRESGRLDETAWTFACTWKAADTNTAASMYDFLGVMFDHVGQTVTLSAKLRGRLLYFIGFNGLHLTNIMQYGGSSTTEPLWIRSGGGGLPSLPVQHIESL